MDWISLLPQSKDFKVLLKTLPTKGNLAWEYNPLRNYRLSLVMYEYKDGLYSEDELISKGLTVNSPGVTKRLKGELVDFISSELSFSLEHPVLIIPQYSYDGSVNLILNDGYNTPKLINTRFSTTGKDTYEIINRKGDGDTNIYDLGTLFDIDTSLYKRVNSIPKLELKSVTQGGNLKVGNYHFYFTFTDADGNETDFVAESSVVSIFIGHLDPHTICTGNRDENSLKLVNFILSNIDDAYLYVQVYYSRTYAEDLNNAVTSYKKIDKKYLVNNRKIAEILITGFEEEIEVTQVDINPMYNVVDYAKASATAKNMLFLGNVHKPTIPYKELSDLSLRFLPYLKNETYDVTIDLDYKISSKNKGYYDPKFIYNNVGYWDLDLYRLGVVYLLSNGELSPVFNIRGGINIPEYTPKLYTQYNYYDENHSRVYIQFNEANNYILPPEESEGEPPTSSPIKYENTKGVVSFNSLKDTDTIHAIEIRGDEELITNLKKLGIKGFFFVRQKRMPLTLCEGITITTDNTSHTPTIPCKGGIVNNVILDSEASYVSYDYIDDGENLGPAINYVSEGFLSRYKYKFASRKSNGWEIFGQVTLGVVIAAAIVVGTIFTCGAAGVAAGAGIATVLAAGIDAVVAGAGIAIGAAAIVVATAATGAIIAGVSEGIANHRAVINPNTKTFNGRDHEPAPKNYVQQELDSSRLLNASFADRVIIKGALENTVNAILCPEYDVNYPYLNQLFTGLEFVIKTTTTQALSKEESDDGSGLQYFLNNSRHFYIPAYVDVNYRGQYSCKIQAVPDNVKVVMLGTTKFRSRAGWAEEAWRYESVGGDYKKDMTKINGDYTESQEEDENGDNINVEQTVGQINSDIIRGEFGPYLGISNYGGGPCENVRIMIPGYKDSNMEDYIAIRMNDVNPFFAISDRIDINNLEEYYLNHSNLIGDLSNDLSVSFTLHRGDCYLCLFTHRINRNFKDPSAPYNDDCVDAKSWKTNYTPLKTEQFVNINLGDVNAVELGMWCTFKVRSSMNLNVRSLDNSNVAECAMMGHPKGFYPYLKMITEGPYKSEEALVYNKGFQTSVSSRLNFVEPDVPAIKNWFGTRIMYSDIQVNDAFKNNFRVFRGTTFRDYTRQYGEITKLLNYKDNLLVIFEHGIGIAAINEKMVAALSTTGLAYITTGNVLPEDLTIISDMFGSQWPESVIITPNRGDVGSSVFGVDTVAKKIWEYNSRKFSIISDFKVQEFLNNNITLGEREKTPMLGVRNVKTFYNAFKLDVLFTFYDNLTGFEEKAWNLCYNITLGKFITFYSWIPSMMENIDNIPFSFDRTTAKWITKLGISHANNSFSKGIVLDTNVYLPYSNGVIGTLSLSNDLIPSSVKDITYEFKLCRDIWGNYKSFEIENNQLKFKDIVSEEITTEDGTTNITFEGDSSSNVKTYSIFYELGVTELYYRNKEHNAFGDWDINKISYYDRLNSSDSPSWSSLAEYYDYAKDLPIYKAKNGIRPTLDIPVNNHNLVQLLNVECLIYASYTDSTELTPNGIETPTDDSSTKKLCIGTYLSTIAITSTWNMQFLTTDFWKHGLAGLIDIADDIYPTYWYGKLHPFEFEVIVVGDPSQHKIFRNLELIANKALPESFHYEIIGECYDFAKDKPNMYFRLEARKALFQYNGCDITYDHSFTKIDPKQVARSAETISYYTERQDTINDIYDSYAYRTSPNKDYSLLSGTEITYYKNRQEFRLWSHQKAVNIDTLSQDTATSLIRGNCQYLEDKWLVSINPILVAYKNEYVLKVNGILCLPSNSTWVKAYGSEKKLPPITIYNTNIPNVILLAGQLEFPNSNDNALYHLYDEDIQLPIDPSNWLNDISIYKYNFGEALNRKEIDLKDKFMKVRIRYSGTELAVIDFLNTLYEVSFA